MHGAHKVPCDSTKNATLSAVCYLYLAYLLIYSINPSSHSMQFLLTAVSTKVVSQIIIPIDQLCAGREAGTPLLHLHRSL